jgi:putative transposase
MRINLLSLEVVTWDELLVPGQHLDDLMSRISQATKQQIKPMRQAAHPMRRRIRNLVDSCQKQTACYLTSNYRVIFLPTF